MTPEQRARRNEIQKKYRDKNGNRATHKYEKTKKGFLVRLYRNMKSRITGVQKVKAHLYSGKDLLPKEEFYTWALGNPDYHALFDAYEKAGYPMKLAPSVDRKRSEEGYVLGNMEFVTHAENSGRGKRGKILKSGKWELSTVNA